MCAVITRKTARVKNIEDVNQHLLIHILSQQCFLYLLPLVRLCLQLTCLCNSQLLLFLSFKVGVFKFTPSTLLYLTCHTLLQQIWHHFGYVLWWISGGVVCDVCGVCNMSSACFATWSRKGAQKETLTICWHVTFEPLLLRTCFMTLKGLVVCDNNGLVFSFIHRHWLGYHHYQVTCEYIFHMNNYVNYDCGR